MTKVVKSVGVNFAMLEANSSSSVCVLMRVVSEIHLVKSTLTSQGPIYEVVKSYPLAERSGQEEPQIPEPPRPIDDAQQS